MANGQFIKPLGRSLSFPGRPVDMAVHPNGKWLYVKEHRGLTVIDLATWKVIQELASPGGASYTGLVLNLDGTKIYFSNAGSTVHEGQISDDGKVAWTRKLNLDRPKVGGDAYPCGLLLSEDQQSLFVCSSRGNEIQQIDLGDGKVADKWDTDIAPYELAVSPDRMFFYVTCWGGKRPGPNAKTAMSSGTPVEIDNQGKSKAASIAVHDLANRTYRSIRTGLQPSDIVVAKDGRIFVANANNDTITVVAADFSRSKNVVVKPDPLLPFGSAPNALALDGDTLYVACGGNNAVAVVDVKGDPIVEGFMPTGWYPASLSTVDGNLFIGNVKGTGSRGKVKDANGYSVYSFSGSVQRIDLAERSRLAAHTKSVKELNATKEMLEAVAAEAEEEIESDREALVPIPDRPGERSSIKHVVYVIKENRTYDQVFGDIEKGEGDPKLCLFGRNVTPNQHALAEQFVLLDNYYCNGVNSADGHAWSVEGNASSHFERSFGGWTRSYPFGDDPISVSAGGFIWDNVLRWGKTFRNYGEYDYASEKPDSNWLEIYRDWKSGANKIKIEHNIGVERLKRYSNPSYPGWDMDISDSYRASIFIKELKEFEKKGTYPNFTILYLPQDHTSGTSPNNPTPRACVADNDLALGKCVEALSKSKFWKDMAIFVIEDDPQAGIDHVDGHRSTCLVISPYTRSGKVISKFYNQSSVVATMQRILALPPLTQMDARAPLMDACFGLKPNLTPFKSLANRVPIDEQNPPPKALSATGRNFADISARLPRHKPDLMDEKEQDLFNRAIWFSIKGAKPYPSALAGPHGKGLKKRKLVGSFTDFD